MDAMKLLLLLLLTALEMKADDPPETLPVSEQQLVNLAQRVCFYFVQDPNEDVEREKCAENFTQPTDTLQHVSKAMMTSRKEKRVDVEVEPSEDLQLVILVPANNTGAFINYGIVRPNKTTVTIETRSQKNLQIWTTTLDKWRRSGLWMRGPKVPNWEPRAPYEVKMLGDYHLDELDGTRVKATFGWNNTEGNNFTVKNNCQFPGEELDIVSNASSYTVHGLRLNSKCRFSVADEYGHGTLNFKIPECVEDVCVMKKPTGIEVYTEEVPGDGYDVTVAWAKPEHPPLKYNVSVRSNNTYYVTVDGSSTNATIKNVKGSALQMFRVTVTAIPTSGLKAEREIVKAIFSPKTEQNSSIGASVLGSLCSVLLAVMAAVGIIWRVRAHRRNKWIKYPGEIVINLPKKMSIESFGPEPSIVEDKWEVAPDRLLLHEVIGEGAFGVVRKGILQPAGKEVGVKMLKDCPLVEEIRSFRAEMELMKSVGAHPHVVSLVGCCSRRRLMIVSEYCSRGDLLNFLRCALGIMVSKRNAKYYMYNNNIEIGAEYRNDLFTNKLQNDTKFVNNKLYDLHGVCDAELTPVDLLSFCRQIAMGMEFLSSNRVVHRDLAARNVLVTSDRTLKIADFGLSRDVYQENQYKQKGSGKLPVKWMALESLMDRIYTSQSDVWSFGIVIWEVVTVGGSPYPGVPATQLIRLLRSGYRMPRPNNCSKQLYEIMLSCWRERPRDRPTFADLHRQLDQLLNTACADDYLTLDVEGDYAPPTPKMPRYMGIIARTKRYWSNKAELYEKPLKTTSNHYTSPPDTLSRTQVV